MIIKPSRKPERKGHEIKQGTEKIAYYLAIAIAALSTYYFFIKIVFL
jgi:hypothetical protein